jgi:hypothetical protein
VIKAVLHVMDCITTKTPPGNPLQLIVRQTPHAAIGTMASAIRKGLLFGLRRSVPPDAQREPEIRSSYAGQTARSLCGDMKGFPEVAGDPASSKASTQADAEWL